MNNYFKFERDLKKFLQENPNKIKKTINKNKKNNVKEIEYKKSCHSLSRKPFSFNCRSELYKINKFKLNMFELKVFYGDYKETQVFCLSEIHRKYANNGFEIMPRYFPYVNNPKNLENYVIMTVCFPDFTFYHLAVETKMKDYMYCHEIVDLAQEYSNKFLLEDKHLKYKKLQLTEWKNSKLYSKQYPIRSKSKLKEDLKMVAKMYNNRVEDFDNLKNLSSKKDLYTIKEWIY